MSRRRSSANSTKRPAKRSEKEEADDKDVDEELLQTLSELRLSTKVLEPDQCNLIIPKCIKMLNHKNMKVRADAITALVGQLYAGSQAMRTFVEELCMALVQESVMIPKTAESCTGDSDEDSVMRYQRGLSSIVTLLQSSFPDVLTKHFKSISEFLVQWTGSDKVEQAVAGCEYWAKLSAPPVPQTVLQPWIRPVRAKLPVLIPNLLSCMIYRESHAAFLEQHGSTTAENSHQVPMTPEIERFSNIRNYAALGFENVCRILQSEAVPVFKPYLEKWIRSDNWMEVETAVLAMSAFTEAIGIPPPMRDVCPAVVAQILEFFSHPKPLVRSIACFAMPHFVNLDLKGIKDPLPKVLRSTSDLLKDDCHEVRSIAIRSLATILAYASSDISPYLSKIVDSLVRADPVMAGESRSVYFECIGHLFGRTASVLESKDVDRLLDPLMRQWKQLEWMADASTQAEDDDVSVVRLCQTLCVIANFSKLLFAPYTPEIFAKASAHMDSITSSCKEGEGNVKSMDIVTGHLVAYLDLLSAIFDGQGADAFMHAVQHSIGRILYDILSNSSLHNKVHQSALALLGHLAQYATGPTDPKLDSFVDIIGAKIANSGGKARGFPNTAQASRTDEVVNNALWALVFIAKDKTSNKEKLFSLVDDLIKIFKRTDGHPGCIINAAWALTNMCALWPKQTVGVIVKEDVFLHLCSLLQTQFPRELEKAEIFKNVCSILSLVVTKIPAEFWLQFLVAAALNTMSDEELQKSLQSLIHEIRATLGNTGWNKLSQEMGSQLSYALRKRYKLY